MNTMNDADIQARLAAMHSAYEAFFPELKTASAAPSAPHSNIHLDGQGTIDFLDTAQFLPASQMKLDPSRRYSATSSNFLTALDKLESAFSDIVASASRTRTLSLSEGFTQLQASKLINEIAQLLGDIDKFQFERIDAIVVGNDEVSAQDTIRGRRKSLNRRILLLRQEVEKTHQLLTRILSLPPEAYDPQDIYWRVGITPPNQLLLSLAPDWSEMRVLHQKHNTSNLCKLYVSAAEEKILPVCDVFYTYLSNTNIPSRLLLNDYAFNEMELELILSFISSRKQLKEQLEHLYINNCQLSDSDCATLAEHIVHFSNLKSLSLKQNNITSAGIQPLAHVSDNIDHSVTCIGDISTSHSRKQFLCQQIDCFGVVSVSALIQHGFLRRLGFDDNPLSDAGFYVLLQAILNPYRQARMTMLCPSPVNTDVSVEQFLLKVAELVVFEEENYISLEMTETENSIEDTNSNRKKHKKKGKNKHIRAIWRRVKVKLFSVFAFLRLKNRGILIEYLSVQNCRLSEFSVPMLAQAVTDNLYLCDLHLSDNLLFGSTEASADIAALIEGDYIRVAELKNTGLTDEGIKIICQAAKKSTFLQRLDISGNNVTSTAATWLVNAAGDYFIDAFEVSTVPARNYGADVL